MGNNWTLEQRTAIDIREKNILVSAAAGSGKTAVLVTRIINLIKDENIDIDKLLVVTFTNAAASEMRERIGNALEEELSKNKSPKLQKQLILLNRANITTIHSFCLGVIRNNFSKIDIDPKFRIGDETELSFLKDEVLEEVLEENYEKGEEDFLDLVEAYSNKSNDDGLKDVLMNIYYYAISSPFPRIWLNNINKDYKIGSDFTFSNSKWSKDYLNSIGIELKGYKEVIESNMELIKGIEEMIPYYKTLEVDLININRLIENADNSFESLVSISNSFTFDTIGRCKKGADEELRDRVKKSRDNIKKGVNGLIGDVKGMDNEEIKLQIETMSTYVQKLVQLTIEFIDRYEEKKRDRNIIDFNDIEHLSLLILGEYKDGIVVEKEAATKLKENFYEILVDEYQDTNNVQETIISLVSKKSNEEQNVFMVGDIKQSIYRFRQANPDIFNEKYNLYSKDINDKFVKILLNKNFRSRKEIIDGVNHIFKSIMSKEIGEIDYSLDEMLYLGANYENIIDTGLDNIGGIDIHLIDKNEEEESITSKEVKEARLIGNIIEGLVDSNFGVYDGNIKGLRKVAYRDIAILARSSLNIAPAILEELKKREIPAYFDGGSTFFQTLEIKLMCSYLKAIDNPYQDIPLVSILRSPMYKFTGEDLGKLRLKDKKAPFFKLLKNFKYEEKEIKGKIDFFLSEYNYFVRVSKIMPLDEFIYHLMTKTGYYGYLATLKGGLQRQANLRLLFQKAGDFKNNGGGIFRFVKLIDKINKSNTDFSSAKVIGELDNVVRIMSIHKSKGLEFPIVIVAGIGKKFNLLDASKSVLLHKDLGAGLNVINIKRKLSYPSLIKNSISKRIKIENLSEEMRILYVAFTRAKERLILTGVVNGREKTMEKWDSVIFKNEMMSKSSVLKSSSYLDWIGPCICRDDSIIKKYFYTPQDLEENEIKEDKIINSNLAILKSQIFEKLNYEYPYNLSSKIPSKLTVSEVKKIIQEEESEGKNILPQTIHKKPKFLEESSKLKGADRGTAYHSLMERLNFNIEDDKIKEEIDSIYAKGYLSLQGREVIEEDKIKLFLKSNLGKRLKKSDNIKREVEFIIEVNANSIYKELQEEIYKDEKILLQGVIDCFFYEGDNIILIDYKTDKCDLNGESILISRYREQLKFYKLAIEKMTNKKVTECYLYLFSINKEIKVE